MNEERTLGQRHGLPAATDLIDDGASGIRQRGGVLVPRQSVDEDGEVAVALVAEGDVGRPSGVQQDVGAPALQPVLGQKALFTFSSSVC
ncbi:hypothetical protein ACWGHM_13535 [Streptomyces sp. NPDC054904]